MFDIETKEEEKTQEEREAEEQLHLTCALCYPPSEVDYMISLCGILKPDTKLPPVIGGNHEMCEICRSLIPSHLWDTHQIKY